jgi:acyl-CoA synthetase (NDP forming)
MTTVDYDGIDRLLASIHADGRTSLYENECYGLLALTGAEAAPRNRLIPAGNRPTLADLEAIPGSKVVLKVVSPDITHKTEARGVRIVANEIGAVEAAFDLMMREVPEAYAEYLESHTGEIPSALIGLKGEGLRQRLAKRIVGILLCSFARSDANGLATELFVGIRHTAEFGHIITAGLGGVEMEILARRTREGAAVVIAPTATTDGARFLSLFRGTLSYQRLTGSMRGSRRLVDDAVLEECFQAFIDLANHFSDLNPAARYHVVELEVNPFAMSGGRMAPLDGVCAFRPASEPVASRTITKIENLLRPNSIAVLGASERSMNMGRIILRNILDAGFAADRAFVVRPGVDVIDGIRCVPSIVDLPAKVDLFIVAVGAPQVPAVVSELIEHDRANAVILIPGGLGEKEGSQELEARLRATIRDAHARPGGGPLFLGGNSMGVVSHPGRYDTTFIPESKLARSRGERGRRACFISQSGAFSITNQSRLPRMDPLYALTIGNQIDLTAGDLVRFLSDDPDVDVFAIYMEGFRPDDGLAVAAGVRAAVELGKDVVFYKAGRTSEGRSATAGHTASVAGDYAVFSSALTQAGAFVASDFDEFSDLVNLCLHLRDTRLGGNRLAAISNAGFESVGMADSIRQEHAELRLVPFSGLAATALHETLARHKLDRLVDVKNPLDLTPMASDEVYGQIVAHVLDNDEVDVVVVGIVPLTPSLQTLPPGQGHSESIYDDGSIARLLPAVARGSRKPVVAVVDSGQRFDPLADELEDGGLPVFRAADRAVRVLCKWVDVKLENS